MGDQHTELEMAEADRRDCADQKSVPTQKTCQQDELQAKRVYGPQQPRHGVRVCEGPPELLREASRHRRYRSRGSRRSDGPV